jgi:hypothetical protein
LTISIGFISFAVTSLLNDVLNLSLRLELTNNLLTKAADAMKELGETDLQALEKSELQPMLDLLDSITINKELTNSSELNLMKMYLEEQISKKIQ